MSDVFTPESFPTFIDSNPLACETAPRSGGRLSFRLASARRNGAFGSATFPRGRLTCQVVAPFAALRSYDAPFVSVFGESRNERNGIQTGGRGRRGRIGQPHFNSLERGQD